MNEELSSDIHLESQNFIEAVNVTYSSTRDHKVIFIIRLKIISFT